MASAADIVVIGQGAIGLACAWQLAIQGVKVTVTGSQDIRSASSNALGVLWPPSPLKQKKSHQLIRTSLDRLPQFVDRLEASSAITAGYQKFNGLELITSSAQLTQAEKEVQSSASILNLVNCHSVADLEPELVCGGYPVLLQSSVARFEVSALLSALKRACLNSGVNFFDNMRIRKILPQLDQSFQLTSDVATIQTEKVLLAAGAYSTFLLPDELKHLAEVKPVKGQYLICQAGRPLLRNIVKNGALYCVPLSNNQIAIGASTEPEAGYNLESEDRLLNNLFESACDLLPALKTTKIIERKVGLRPASIDRLPIIGNFQEIPGLCIASAHYKVGLSLLPLTCAIIESIVCKQPWQEDYNLFAPRVAVRLKKGEVKQGTAAAIFID